MLERTTPIIVALMSTIYAVAGNATAASDCNGRLVYVDDTSSVGDNYPLFMKTRRNIYVLRGSCFMLSGSEFRGSITFFTLSRAPEGFNGTYGELVVKSNRTFNVPTQSKKIKLSRNTGWYLPDPGHKDNMVIVPPLDDFPTATSVADWNALHSNPKKPELFEGLDIKWHAYPAEDRLISSTTWASFWNVASNDLDKRVVTNYLLRFGINPDKRSQSRVPFYVMTPKEVERVDLSVESNVGSLSTSYTFIFK